MQQMIITPLQHPQICSFLTSPCSSLTNGLSHGNTQWHDRIFYHCGSFFFFSPPFFEVLFRCQTCPSPFLRRRDGSQLKRAADATHLGKASQEQAKTETDAEAKMAPHRQGAGLLLQVNIQHDRSELISCKAKLQICVVISIKRPPPCHEDFMYSHTFLLRRPTNRWTRKSFVCFYLLCSTETSKHTWFRSN